MWKKPDILSIITQPEQHAEAMIYGAENGVKGMYAEKPLCCSLNEADAITEAFERNNVFLEFGPMRRHWPVYQQARRMVSDCDSVHGLTTGHGIGGHFLDTLLYLLDDPEPVSIRGTLVELHPAKGDTTNMRFVRDTLILSADVSFRNGKHLSTKTPASGAEYKYKQLRSDDYKNCLISNDSKSLRVYDSPRSYPDVIEVEPRPSCSTEHKVRELVESIKTGVPGVSNLRATMLGTEIGFGIYESHLRDGAEVHLPVPNRDRWVSR